MLVFPQPQLLEQRDGTLTLATSKATQCQIILAPDADPIERLAADLVADALAARGTARPSIGASATEGMIPISIGETATKIKGMATALAEASDSSDAHALIVGENGIALQGRTAQGTFYAAQTLTQLLDTEDTGDTVCGYVQVVDWPDYQHRGLYIESKWGPDLMELQDWKDLIDYMAGLKFNSLGIGVYCCWGVQYDGKRTEFLMVPFPEHPELQTPKTIQYYSPASGEWKGLNYLPRMFTEDFFGEVIEYGKSRAVTVRPHFNGPGHTTLIPCTHPEIAAKDASGTPRPYGYCLSSPQTYELLFELWDSIIDRYLAPNGIDWFHMGLDEIWTARGVDQKDPERRVSPWCECPDCQEHTSNELLVNYVVKATQHLAEKGINNICIWNDHLARHGILTEDFVRRLEEAGVRDKVVLQWWRYDEPVLEITPGLGLRAWTTPMPGYYFWLFTQSYTSNIYPHLHLAHRAGAEGADAYCVFDPAFDRNYTCLAEYAWNQTSTGDLYQFKSRYAQKVTGRSGFDAAEPFEKWDQVYDSMPLVGSTLDILLYYWHTYSSARNEYPANVVKALANDQMRSRVTYRKARTHLSRAQVLFAACRNTAPNPELIDEYVFECERLIAVVDVYDIILKGIDETQMALADPASAGKQGLENAAVTFSEAVDRLDTMMAQAEAVKKPYLLPQLLRDLSQLRAYANELNAAASEAASSQQSVEGLQQLLAEVV